MSTTIYHGYKLPVMNAIELNEFLVRFRKLAEKKAGELCANAMANLLSDNLDDLAIFGKEQFVKMHLKGSKVSEEEAEKKFRFCSSIFHVYMETRDRYYEIQRTSQRDPAMDFDCDAIIIPLEDKTLVLFYAERKEFRELWKEQAEVVEHFYYDNVEPDKKVSKEEWEQRKQDWLTVWTNDKEARELGMEVKFARGIPERYEIQLEEIISQMPSLDKRASSVAWNKLYDNKFKEFRDEKEDWLDTDRRVSRWIRSEEGQLALKEMTEQCKGKIVPEFTIDHLRQTYEEFLNQLSK